MSRARENRDGATKPLEAVDASGGLRVGLLAFAGAFVLVFVLLLYELGASPGDVLAGPTDFVQGTAWLFVDAHVGAGVRPLVLLEPDVLLRVPGWVFYLVPAASLTLGGAWLGRGNDHDGPPLASFAGGAAVAAGYLAGVLVATAYLSVSQPYVPGPTAREFLVPGILYPVAFGGLGGLLARWRESTRGVEQSWDPQRSAQRTGERAASGSGSEQPARTPAESTASGWGSQESAHETGATAPDEWDGRERDHQPASAASTGQGVHFEETLTHRFRWRQFARGAGVMLLLFALPVGLIPLFAPESADLPWPPVLAPFLVFVGGLALLGGVTSWLPSRLHVEVRVTDEGVDVRRNWSPLWVSPGVFIPFDAIGEVQYSDASGSWIRVLAEDARQNWRSMREADGFITWNTREHRPQTYMVTRPGDHGINPNYKGGVRIGRRDRPPVYVGSERPLELANAIAERAPEVGSVEQL